MMNNLTVVNQSSGLGVYETFWIILGLVCLIVGLEVIITEYVSLVWKKHRYLGYFILFLIAILVLLLTVSIKTEALSFDKAVTSIIVLLILVIMIGIRTYYRLKFEPKDEKKVDIGTGVTVFSVTLILLGSIFVARPDANIFHLLWGGQEPKSDYKMASVHAKKKKKKTVAKRAIRANQLELYGTKKDFTYGVKFIGENHWFFIPSGDAKLVLDNKNYLVEYPKPASKFNSYKMYRLHLNKNLFNKKVKTELGSRK